MNIDRLKQNGIDYEEGLRRFSGHNGLYEKYLRRLADLDIYRELHTAWGARNVEEAFQAAHKLKAFIGNLSIPILFEEVSKMTEVLRAGETTGVEESMKFIDAEMEKLSVLMKEEIAEE